MCSQTVKCQSGGNCTNQLDAKLLTIEASHANGTSRLSFQQEIQRARRMVSPNPGISGAHHSMTTAASNIQSIRHSHLHVGRRIHGFPCTNCNRMFSSITNYKKHFGRVHLEVKPFKCKLCRKGFTTKASADNHFKALHFMEFLQETKAKAATASTQMSLPSTPPSTTRAT
jgi:hypothetical protein